LLVEEPDIVSLIVAVSVEPPFEPSEPPASNPPIPVESVADEVVDPVSWPQVRSVAA
jgi:hypothetical protein